MTSDNHAPRSFCVRVSVALIVALVWITPVPSSATTPLASVVLEWDPKQEPFVTDYVVFYGTRSGFLPFTLRTDGLTRVTIPRLKSGLTYYFAVRAMAWSGLFSDLSEEISYTVPAACEADPILLTVVPLANAVSISFPGVPGAKYELFASSDVKNWRSIWTSPIASDPGPTAFAFVDESGQGQLFYRAQIVGRYRESKELGVSQDSGQGYTLRFTGVFGSIYELQSSEDALTWNPFWSRSADATADIEVEDPRPDLAGTRRHRLLVSADPQGPYWDPCTAATNEPPTVTDIPYLQLHLGDPPAELPFTVNDVDTPLGMLALRLTSSNPDLLPQGGIQIGGDGTTRWLVLHPADGAFGVSHVTLSISDGDNEVMSSFEFEVLPYAAESLRPAIVIYGDGTVRPSLSGHDLIAGKRYTITAVPAPGQTFVSWGGAVSGNSRTLSFVMEPEFLIEAYFAPSPFPAIQGTYQGLLGPADGPIPGSAGLVTVTVTSSGGYSGSYMVGGRKQAFSGTLTFDRTATNTIVRPGTNTLTVELAFGADASEPLQGFVRGAAPETELLAYRSGYDTNPPPFQGSYTVVLPGMLDDNDGPEGAGFGALQVDKLGRVSLTGILADGTKVSGKVALGPGGRWPVSIPLQSGQAILQGWLSFNPTNSDSNSNILSGNLSWLAPANSRIKLPLYRDGFTNEIELLGASYVRPDRTGRILPLTETMISFQGGNLAGPFTNSIALREGSRVDNLGDNPLTLIFNPANGSFKGTVTDPVSGHSYRYAGAVLQDRAEGWGQLLGTNRSARVGLGF